ncbi:MAG: hypothetical protein AAFX94_07860, partial [Myxococcota bacterium]
IGGCERCVERMDERTRGFAAFEGLDPGAVWERVEEQGKVIAFPRRAAWVGGGLVAAAAALLFVVSPPGATDGVRLKGGATLRLHRQVEGGSEVLSSGASARPGDRVRFEVGLPAAGVVAIYGVEASGDRYTARPAEFLDAGTGQLLEGAVALDPSLGAEVQPLKGGKAAGALVHSLDTALAAPDPRLDLSTLGARKLIAVVSIQDEVRRARPRVLALLHRSSSRSLTAAAKRSRRLPMVRLETPMTSAASR